MTANQNEIRKPNRKNFKPNNMYFEASEQFDSGSNGSTDDLTEAYSEKWCIQIRHESIKWNQLDNLIIGQVATFGVRKRTLKRGLFDCHQVSP